MNSRREAAFLAAASITFGLFSQSHAGVPIEPAPSPINGALSFGYQGSEQLHTGTIDLLQPLLSPSKDVAFFYDGRFSFDDSSQDVQSHGLVFRYRLPDQDVIIGANLFYDSVDSAYDHQFDQFGAGIEVLTKWVDFRANYYLPDQKREQIARRTVNNDHHEVESTILERGRVAQGGLFIPFYENRFTEVNVTDREQFARFESPLEGLNTELGLLLPVLDRYAEVRIYGGYYHYLNPYGSDYDGLTTRLEARLRQGITAEVEYWDDKVLTGGHWTGGVRVSLPFNLGNLFAGRNPFEGAGEAFGPVSHDFADRLSEPVHRSHRVKTTTSGYLSAGYEVSRTTRTGRSVFGLVRQLQNGGSGSGLGGGSVSGGSLGSVGSISIESGFNLGSFNLAPVPPQSFILP